MQENNTSHSVQGRSWPDSLVTAYHKFPRHWARYKFAEQLAIEKTVCDAACGVGYGSYLLGQVANNVVGMDIGEDAIEWAKSKFSSGNVIFKKADLNGFWPTQQKFDLVTSFETLEHLEKPNEFLNNLVRHLKGNGKLILSVPNGPKDYKSKRTPGKHIQFFSKEELKEILEERFHKITFLSQYYKKNIKHYIVKMLSKGSVRIPENFTFIEGLHDEINTWLAIAENPKNT